MPAKPSRDNDSDDADSTPNYVRHCFVLCETAEPRDLSQAQRVVTEVFGRGYSASVDEGMIVTVSCGNEAIGFLAHMPVPIPNDEAAENAAGNFLWRDGKEEAARHQSHVIVANSGVGEPAAIESALIVSRLALVALQIFDGLGVYWGNASVSNSREVFEDFCSDMSEEHLPLPVWLRFQLVQAENDELGLYTLGMSQFDLMEIEVDRCELDVEGLFEFVCNIAHYLIQSGPVIEDGNTVGGTPEERILVRHEPSMIDPDRLVYKIIFE